MARARRRVGGLELTLELFDLDRGLAVAADMERTTVLADDKPMPPDDPTDPTDVSTLQRAAGRERVETAVLASQMAFPDGADTVLLARSDRSSQPWRSPVGVVVMGDAGRAAAEHRRPVVR